jgi:predicted DNA-binding transcriptional regulator AlpA
MFVLSNQAFQEALITRQQLEELLKISRATIYRRMKEDDLFPRGIRLLGGRAVRWRLSDVLAYVELSKEASGS